MMRGSFIFSKTAAPIRPKRNTNAKDANIEISFWAAAQTRLRDESLRLPSSASRRFEHGIRTRNARPYNGIAKCNDVRSFIAKR